MHAAVGVRVPLPSSIWGQGPLTPVGIPGQAQADPEDTSSQRHRPSWRTNHGDVTSPWSGPPRCDIAVVQLRATWPDSMIPVRAMVPVRAVMRDRIASRTGNG